MATLSREEFNKIYKDKFEPLLGDLEVERIAACKKAKPYRILSLIGLILVFVCFFIIFPFNIFNVAVRFCLVIFTFLILAIGAFTYDHILKKYMKVFKQKVTSKVLLLYGNMYFSERKEVISQKEIEETGLFPNFSSKKNDDTIIGICKGCNFIICETELTHREESGKSSHTVTDFKGVIIKVQSKKPFTGKTSVGFSVSPQVGMEPVELESVEFMKRRQVYSTDQIEARYILTPSFIEKLESLQGKYSTNRLVSAAFMEGYVYIFIPSWKNFFEIPFDKTLFNPDNYYNIYQELDYILDIVNYLNLDKNLGL